MKMKAIGRGVCYGVNKYAVAGEVFDVDPAMAQFMVSIGHERVVDEPPAADHGKKETGHHKESAHEETGHKKHK